MIAAALLGYPLAASPQSVRVRVEENFRREPNGVVLARLATGTPLRVIRREGNWTHVELLGWVWLGSLQDSDETAFDLVVSIAGGENLRVAPAGRILARLEEGALLDELERDASWAQVGRQGWVWSASLESETSGSEPGPMIQPEAPGLDTGPASRRPDGFASVGAVGAPILTAPDGDTLAVAAPRSDVEVVGRQGSWVRVRLEGWMWMPGADEATTVVDDTPTALEPSDLVADPSGHNGRVVQWTLQFISLERAEAVRTDFFEGEPFLLARFGGAEGPFVYVAVAPHRLGEVEGLVPLERISVTARVRTGASALTDTPIVDLLGIERSREAP